MMNDRFLVKAKWLKTGEWVEGYYCRISETTYCPIGDVPPIPVHHYILQETTTDWGLPNRFLQFEVDPNTICQCTDLEDKNGKPIFENDIMEAHIDELAPEDVSQFKVEWSGNGWVMVQPVCTDREYISKFETKVYEVVGNAFDNFPDRSINTPTDILTKQLYKELNNGDNT